MVTKTTITVHLPSSLKELIEVYGEAQAYELAMTSLKIEIAARARQQLAEKQIRKAVRKLGTRKLAQIARALGEIPSKSNKKGGKK